MIETLLSQQEKKWLLERKVSRLSDQKEVQIYPMGAERYLASILIKNNTETRNFKQDILKKKILIIPGHGNSGFLFAEAGASTVTIYDKDPVTLAWIKAFKKYYHYRGPDQTQTYPSIGELLTALTAWYPPLLRLPSGNSLNKICWLLYPQQLRKTYLFYMLSLVQQALLAQSSKCFELEKELYFYCGTIEAIKDQDFDTAFVPYLLGVQNGIEKEEEILSFMKLLFERIPEGKIFITPSQNKKEYGLIGKSYFVTTKYPSIQTIPELQPYFLEEKDWFHNQGLAVFHVKQLKS